MGGSTSGQCFFKSLVVEVVGGDAIDARSQTCLSQPNRLLLIAAEIIA